jgi:large subunit ribosomal protein L21
MTNYAVVKTGGKQYLVKEDMEIVVDRLPNKEKETVELETLATFDDKDGLELGAPSLAKKTSAVVVNQIKGDKIRVAQFKSKVRYRKVRGFRAQYSTLKIGKI